VIDKAFIDSQVAALVTIFGDSCQPSDLGAVWTQVWAIAETVDDMTETDRKKLEYDLLCAFIDATDTWPGPPWAEATGDFLAKQFFKWALDEMTPGRCRWM